MAPVQVQFLREKIISRLLSALLNPLLKNIFNFTVQITGSASNYHSLSNHVRNYFLAYCQLDLIHQSLPERN